MRSPERPKKFDEDEMSDLIANCPKCQRAAKVSAANAGKRVRCPACDTIFTGPLPDKPTNDSEGDGDLDFTSSTTSSSPSPREPSAAMTRLSQLAELGRSRPWCKLTGFALSWIVAAVFSIVFGVLGLLLAFLPVADPKIQLPGIYRLGFAVGSVVLFLVAAPLLLRARYLSAVTYEVYDDRIVATCPASALGAAVTKELTWREISSIECGELVVIHTRYRDIVNTSVLIESVDGKTIALTGSFASTQFAVHAMRLHQREAAQIELAALRSGNRKHTTIEPFRFDLDGIEWRTDRREEIEWSACDGLFIDYDGYLRFRQGMRYLQTSVHVKDCQNFGKLAAFVELLMDQTVAFVALDSDELMRPNF